MPPGVQLLAQRQGQEAVRKWGGTDESPRELCRASVWSPHLKQT